MTVQPVDFMDLLIVMCMEKRDTDIDSIKQFLNDIDHLEKDNASFIYEFSVWVKEPMCIK